MVLKNIFIYNCGLDEQYLLLDQPSKTSQKIFLLRKIGNCHIWCFPVCCLHFPSASPSLCPISPLWTELTENCPCTGRDLSNVDSDPKDHFLSNMSWLFFVNEKSYQLCIFRGCLPFRHNICHLVEYRILAWRSHARIKFFARRAKNFFY